jgi:hypothetical protein
LVTSTQEERSQWTLMFWEISFKPCYSSGLPLGELPPTGPEVPKKEIQPLLGVKDHLLRGFGISAHTPVLFGGEALSPGASGPRRTIRSVMRG